MRVIYRVFLLTAIFLSVSINNIYGQDPVFSQFYATPLLLNPGLAGTTNAPLIGIAHRSQNVGFNQGIPYQDYGVTYDQGFDRINSGFGLIATATQAGNNTLNTYTASGVYSYNLKIDRNSSIRIGLKAGIQYKKIDWNKLVFYDQLNPITGAVDNSGVQNPTSEQVPTQLSKTFLDLGTGLIYTGNKFYAGVSLDHLTRPDDRVGLSTSSNNYSGLPLLTSIHAGYTYKFPTTGTNKGYLSPNLLMSFQGPFRQLNLGGYVSYNRIFGGTWFRHTFGNSDAVIGVVGVEWNVFKIGYSYDLTVSSLGRTSFGSHELSLRINLENSDFVKSKRMNSRYNDCLHLFR